MFKNLYVVTVFRVEEKSEKDLEKERKIQSIRLEREITLEAWKKFNNEEHNYYNFSRDEVAYFDNFEEANDFLIRNSLDINEYVYDKGVIVEIPLNCGYPYTYATNIYFYEFDWEKRIYYSDISWDETLVKMIKNYFGYHDIIAEHYRNLQKEKEENNNE